jgi:hypothetical protein
MKSSILKISSLHLGAGNMRNGPDTAMQRLYLLSSTIQTVLSVPDFHRSSPDISGVADFNRRSGISPCPEESCSKERGKCMRNKQSCNWLVII